MSHAVCGNPTHSKQSKGAEYDIVARGDLKS